MNLSLGNPFTWAQAENTSLLTGKNKWNPAALMAALSQRLSEELKDQLAPLWTSSLPPGPHWDLDCGNIGGPEKTYTKLPTSAPSVTSWLETPGTVEWGGVVPWPLKAGGKR